MWPNNPRSYSNPIYDLIDQPNHSFSQPLVINIEPQCSTTIHSNPIPLLLLANCLTSPPRSNQHNYVNQRIEEENFDPLYAKPRKRCVTLRDDPIIIPAKTTRLSLVGKSMRDSIKAERAQVVCTKMPNVSVLSTNESVDEIDRFLQRENDRVERVKLRRQHKPTIVTQQTEKPPPAFSNPNYVDMPTIDEYKEKKPLSKSILV